MSRYKGVILLEHDKNMKKLKSSFLTVALATSVLASSALAQRVGTPAPDFIPGGEWFNSEPLSTQDLRGEVVLVEIWTFECYNCYRSIPTLRTFYDRYRDQGFEIVGVHTPEFAREKVAANVARALEQHGVTWPVFQDNDFATWRAYDNRVWPAFYLVDRAGIIRYVHRGEISETFPQGVAPLEAMVETLLAEQP